MSTLPTSNWYKWLRQDKAGLATLVSVSSSGAASLCAVLPFVLRALLAELSLVLFNRASLVRTMRDEGEDVNARCTQCSASAANACRFEDWIRLAPLKPWSVVVTKLE